MARIAVTAALLAIAGVVSSCSSRGSPGIDYPYCAVAGGDKGYESCAYVTLQQCLIATSGVGGHCMENPRYVREPYQEAPPARP